MSLELTSYQDRLASFAHVLKHLMDVDVVIVDQWLTPLVNTFHYTREPLDIRVNSVVGNVIVTGKPQVVANRRDNKSCMSCPDYILCELDSIVGVPMHFHGDCVGAMLVVFSARQAYLLNDQAKELLSFLNTVSGMIIRSIEADQTDEQLVRYQRSIAKLMEHMTDCLAFTGEDGKIAFANRNFCKAFGQEFDALKGTSLTDTLRPFLLQTDGDGLRPGVYLTGVEDEPLQLITMESVQGFTGSKGWIYVLRRVDLQQVLRSSQLERMKVQFADFWGVSPQMCAAQAAATTATRNNLHVLIEASSREQGVSLARILSCLSSSDNTAPIMVDCGAHGDELESLLLGDGSTPALLRPSCRGNLCLIEINRVPYHLQVKLHAFLTGRAAAKAGTTKLRIFATSTENLSDLVHKGLFYEELRDYLLKNHIVLPGIEESREDVAAYFQRFVSYFANIYNKPAITIHPNFYDQLFGSQQKLDYCSLRELAEQLVRTLEGTELAELHDGPTESVHKATHSKMDPLEGQIRMLVQQGCQKTDIAKQVGVSRATLYRRLKKYNLLSD